MQKKKIYIYIYKATRCARVSQIFAYWSWAIKPSSPNVTARVTPCGKALQSSVLFVHVSLYYNQDKIKSQKGEGAPRAEEKKMAKNGRLHRSTRRYRHRTPSLYGHTSSFVVENDRDVGEKMSSSG